MGRNKYVIIIPNQWFLICGNKSTVSIRRVLFTDDFVGDVRLNRKINIQL